MEQSSFIDLHIHTIMSDGTDFPEDCLNKAKELGLSAIAITDHNTFGAVEDAICIGEELGIEVIPAIEIDADYIYPFHFLAYFGGMGFLKLQSYFFALRHEGTMKRVENFLAALKKNGIKVEHQQKNKRFLKIYDVLIELCRMGLFSSPFEAERELILGAGRIFKEDAFTLQEVILKVKSAGGLVFWAHPYAYGLNMTEQNIKEEAGILKSLGIDGIEALHYSANKDGVLSLISLARENGLLISGGSDYHGSNRPVSKIGYCGGKLQVPNVVLDKMKEKFAR